MTKKQLDKWIASWPKWERECAQAQVDLVRAKREEDKRQKAKIWSGTKVDD